MFIVFHSEYILSVLLDSLSFQSCLFEYSCSSRGAIFAFPFWNLIQCFQANSSLQKRDTEGLKMMYQSLQPLVKSHRCNIRRTIWIHQRFPPALLISHFFWRGLLLFFLDSATSVCNICQSGYCPKLLERETKVQTREMSRISISIWNSSCIEITWVCSRHWPCILLLGC